MMDYDSEMKRVHSLFAVAKCFAAKGIEKDDRPVWIAETFAMLLDLLEGAVDEAAAARANAKPADDQWQGRRAC